MSFSTLGLTPSIIATVTKLGYQSPTPIQEQAIPMILAKRDVMAGAQTGTGKTGAFAMPIIELLQQQPRVEGSVSALVLTPTRELAQQVQQSFIDYSHGTDLSCEIAYGGVSLNPQISALKQGADVLVATPGRLLDLLFKGAVNLDKLAFLVFDEADRMLDMGFMVDIKRILKRVPDERQTLLFSATFDENLFELSKRLLNNPELIEVAQRNTTAAEIEQIIYNVDEHRKRELTSFMIGSKNWQQVLIFVRTRQGADALAKEMCKDGIKAQSIHGDKSQGARDKALAEFKSGKTRALVATDVAARGLDIEQLNYVINYELPYIAEDYIHRIGRTGRAGNAGLAVSLMSIDENWLLEEIETILDTRLPQAWFPGYEPDLTRVSSDKKNSRASQKRRDQQRASGKGNSNRNRHRSRRK
ncbi:DEAD/DEAH box helicase [Psychrobium sp. 1_MG-2023]|uniref:DEAD/DEAH box helicase n=1 Tax=Psychrobium sp. 1_MG-2023 TaxID=3062624 RepID=UPI000C32158C|nr:DEAD/DEAH box helicase [Psychrobium sp. 1_MG-2023]MDP2560045.1 DEAD/DEAH box helicase [Psychrobium sp. 1_MG-2023]PKF56294.1 DEAD/DEAH box helicase [Alteromonadales bacterium alter-6D02]